uniref:Uncharacterized protein n=2 Tax=Kalanchoe fedtschenkoi TaxID=63787 RepID=A0A7N0V341_KALFE
MTNTTNAESMPVSTHRIGTDRSSSQPETSTKDEDQSLSIREDSADAGSAGSSSRDTRDKEIEEYPRPHAVVGVSVLKGINIDEMLKAIRAAIRKCRDSDAQLELSLRPPDSFRTNSSRSCKCSDSTHGRQPKRL